MGKIIKLKESQLNKIIKQIISEVETYSRDPFIKCKKVIFSIGFKEGYDDGGSNPTQGKVYDIQGGDKYGVVSINTKFYLSDKNEQFLWVSLSPNKIKSLSLLFKNFIKSKGLTYKNTFSDVLSIRFKDCNKMVAFVKELDSLIKKTYKI